MSMKLPLGQMCNLSGIILYPSHCVGASAAGISSSHQTQSIYFCEKSILQSIKYTDEGYLTFLISPVRTWLYTPSAPIITSALTVFSFPLYRNVKAPVSTSHLS